MGLRQIGCFVVILPFLGVSVEGKAHSCNFYLSENGYERPIEAKVTLKEDAISPLVKRFAEMNILFPQMVDYISLGVSVHQILHREPNAHFATPQELDYLSKVMQRVHSKVGISIPINPQMVQVLTFRAFSSTPHVIHRTIIEYLKFNYPEKDLLKDHETEIVNNFFYSEEYKKDRDFLDQILEKILATIQEKNVREISVSYTNSIADLVRNKKTSYTNMKSLAVGISEKLKPLLEEALMTSFPALHNKNKAGVSLGQIIIQSLSLD